MSTNIPTTTTAPVTLASIGAAADAMFPAELQTVHATVATDATAAIKKYSGLDYTITPGMIVMVFIAAVVLAFLAAGFGGGRRRGMYGGRRGGCPRMEVTEQRGNV